MATKETKQQFFVSFDWEKFLIYYSLFKIESTQLQRRTTNRFRLINKFKQK